MCGKFYFFSFIAKKREIQVTFSIAVYILKHSKYQLMPFDYSKVFLVDELKFRAYGQLMDKSKLENQPGIALYYSKLMQDALRQAELKRPALFTDESIEASFGTVKQIYNTGWFGRVIAFFLKTFGFNPHK